MFGQSGKPAADLVKAASEVCAVFNESETCLTSWVRLLHRPDGPTVQSFAALRYRNELKAHAAALAGYDVRETGQVAFPVWGGSAVSIATGALLLRPYRCAGGTTPNR